MQLHDSMKDELVRLVEPSPCCRGAELSAIVKVNGAVYLAGGNRMRLMIKDSSAAVARRTMNLLAEADCREVELVVRMRQRIQKSNSYIIRINSDEKVKGLLTKLGILKDGRLSNEVPQAYSRKKCCARAYIRGVFLGAGYLGKPAYGHHLEIAVEDRLFAESLAELLKKFDMNPKVIERRTYFVVYLKEGDDIVQFLNVTGAHSTLLEFENSRVIKSIRNDVNRLVNAEQANLEKTVEASVLQVDSIRRIAETVGLSRLSPPLAEAARLRLDNPDATLSELGRMMDPPISKSGMNHRMRRIAAIASKLIK